VAKQNSNPSKEEQNDRFRRIQSQNKEQSTFARMRLSGGNCILFDSASIFSTTWSVEGAWLSSQPNKGKAVLCNKTGFF
jgi:hypothetical protein